MKEVIKMKLIKIGLIAILVVFLAAAFYAITVGIVDILKNFYNDVLQKIDDGWNKTKRWFGMSTVKEGVRLNVIDKENVTMIKTQLEDAAIATDETGMTEVMLRKMLLANEVTSSTSDTLCAVEISPQEILQDTEYTDLLSYLNDVNKIPGANMNNDNVLKKLNVNYPLYYITDSFFYFKDTAGIMYKDQSDTSKIPAEAKQKWYLAIKGKITLTDASGGTLKYAQTKTEFDVKAKEDFWTKYTGKDSAEVAQPELAKQEYLQWYFQDAEGIHLHTITQKDTVYAYSVKNGNVEFPYETGQNTVNPQNLTLGETVVTMNDDADISEHAISIELLMDFLDFTGSPEYVDEFIDYAMEKFNVTISVCSLERIEETLEKRTYKIAGGFIYELYDMQQGWSDDSSVNTNMTFYKYLILDRLQNGQTFNGSIVELENFENINAGKSIGKHQDRLKEVAVNNIVTRMDGTKYLNFENMAKELADEYIYDKNFRTRFIHKNTYNTYFIRDDQAILNDPSYTDVTGMIHSASAGPIKEYLKLAYDPNFGKSEKKFKFSNPEIMLRTTYRTTSNSWEAAITKLETWYGDLTYNGIEKDYDCMIDDKEVEKNVYDSFSMENDMKETLSTGGYEKKTEIYITNTRANEIGIKEDIPSRGIHIINSNDEDANDIYDNKIGKTKLGDNNISNYDIMDLRYLGKVAEKDNGEENDPTGAGKGSDYLYVQYEKLDIAKYKNVVKIKQEKIDENRNIVDYDPSRINEFLGLWKNSTGLQDGSAYSATGKKVKYADIYGGKTTVGDIFESAPEMLFDVLESSDNTQNLADIFRYIMFIYTGTDYGVTSIDDISLILGTGDYAGGNLTVKNDKIANKELILDEAKLRDAITKTFKGEPQTNLLNNVKAFITMQEQYDVNAVFAVAVAMAESQAGTDWDDIPKETYNWMSIKGKYQGKYYAGIWKSYPSYAAAVDDFGSVIGGEGNVYFGAGKYTVQEIAPTYCPGTSKIWAQNVISFMVDMYESIDIQVEVGGITGPVDESGITSYKTIDGSKEYKNYKQNVKPWGVDRLATDINYNMAQGGCAITSVSIVASGFNEPNKNPGQVNSEYRKKGFDDSHVGALAYYTKKNVRWTSRHIDYGETGDSIMNGIVNQLKQGMPTIIKVVNHGHHHTFNLVSADQHFIAILDYREAGGKGQVYVSDPYAGNSPTEKFVEVEALKEDNVWGYFKIY